MKFLTVTAVVSCFTMQAHADVRVVFLEGAPKDKFVITNTGGCALDATQVTLDMANSASAVIFDVTGSGAGVEVFQPLDVVEGRSLLSDIPNVKDGDTALTLSLNGFAQAQTVAFTIDVDDTRAARGTTVSDAELFGAVVSVKTGGGTYTAAFDESAQAVVPVQNCLS